MKRRFTDDIHKNIIMYMSNICKTVTLRTRKIKKGTQLSLYLDYYPGYRDESTMKATIKREQCQTRLSIAEREWVRPKVKVQRHESLGIYIFAKQERSARIQRVKKKTATTDGL